VAAPRRKKAASPPCDFSEFLRGSGRSTGGRIYALVGVLLGRWLQKRSRKFGLDDVKIRRIPGVSLSTIRSYMKDFLSAWEVPADSQSSLATEMLKKCPVLHDKTIKFWNGW
jgi:hypothetical protein